MNMGSITKPTGFEVWILRVTHFSFLLLILMMLLCLLLVVLRCSRVFWSTKSAGKRSVYSIRIYEEQKPLEDITDLSPIEKTSENNFTTAHTPGGKAALRETTDGSEVMRTLPNESESSEGGGFINPSDRLVAPENAIEDVNEQSSAMRAMVDLIKSGQFPDMDSDKDSKLGGKLAEASKGAGIVRQPLHNDTQTSNEMTSLQVEEMAKVNSAQEGQLSSGQRSDSEAVPLQSPSKVISGKDPEVMNSSMETKVSSSAISSQQSLSSSISETFTQDNTSSSRTDLNSAPSGLNSSGNVAMATVEEDSDSNVITLVLDDTLNLSEDIAIQFVDDSSISNQDTEADTGGSVEEQKEGGNEQAVNIGELQDKLSALSRSVENALCTNAAAKSKESKDGSVIEESSAKNDATVAKEEGGSKEISGSSSEKILVKNDEQSSETVGQRKELLGNDVVSEPISSEKSQMRKRTKSDSNASPDEDGISSAIKSKSSRIGESDEGGNHGEKVSLKDDAPPADIPKAQNNNDDVTVRNLGGRKLVVKLDDCQTTSEEMDKKADDQNQNSSSPTKTVRQAGLDENLEILAQTAIEFLEIQNLLEDNRPDQKAAETKVDKSDPPERPLLNNTSDHGDVDSSSKGQNPTKAAEKLKFDTFVAEEHLDTFDLTPPGRKKYPMRTTSSRILRVVNHKEEGVAGPQPVSEENPPPSISPQSDKLNTEVSKAAEDTSSNDIGSAMKSPESVRRSRRGRPPKVKTDDESAKKKEVKSPPALPTRRSTRRASVTKASGDSANEMTPGVERGSKELNVVEKDEEEEGASKAVVSVENEKSLLGKRSENGTLEMKSPTGCSAVLTKSGSSTEKEARTNPIGGSGDDKVSTVPKADDGIEETGGNSSRGEGTVVSNSTSNSVLTKVPYISEPQTSCAKSTETGENTSGNNLENVPTTELDSSSKEQGAPAADNNSKIPVKRKLWYESNLNNTMVRDENHVKETSTSTEPQSKVQKTDGNVNISPGQLSPNATDVPNHSAIFNALVSSNSSNVSKQKKRSLSPSEVDKLCSQAKASKGTSNMSKVVVVRTPDLVKSTGYGLSLSKNLRPVSNFSVSGQSVKTFQDNFVNHKQDQHSPRDSKQSNSQKTPMKSPIIPLSQQLSSIDTEKLLATYSQAISSNTLNLVPSKKSPPPVTTTTTAATGRVSPWHTRRRGRASILRASPAKPASQPKPSENSLSVLVSTSNSTIVQSNSVSVGPQQLGLPRASLPMATPNIFTINPSPSFSLVPQSQQVIRNQIVTALSPTSRLVTQQVVTSLPSQNIITNRLLPTSAILPAQLVSSISPPRQPVSTPLLSPVFINFQPQPLTVLPSPITVLNMPQTHNLANTTTTSSLPLTNPALSALRFVLEQQDTPRQPSPNKVCFDVYGRAHNMKKEPRGRSASFKSAVPKGPRVKNPTVSLQTQSQVMTTPITKPLSVNTAVKVGLTNKARDTLTERRENSTERSFIQGKSILTPDPVDELSGKQLFFLSLSRAE